MPFSFLVKDAVSIKHKIKKCLLVGTAILMSSCGSSEQVQQINIILKYGASKLKCDVPINKHSDFQLEQLQFFLSNFSVNGDPLNLKKTKNQSSTIALLSKLCHSESPDNLTLLLSNKISKGKLRFDLGVPFTENHKNPLTQDSPLNQSDMFWNWQLGHKFLRLDLRNNNPVNRHTGWHFHLGSTGCKSASVMRSPSQRCTQPNRFTYEVDLTSNTLILDLKPLLDTVLSKQEFHSQSCMSESQNIVCLMLLKTLRTNSIWRGDQR